MTVTPLDIEGRRFKRELFGYSRREVDELRRLVADSLSETVLERDEQARLLAAVRKELDDHRSREKTLIDGLAAAERLTAERKALAREEAEKILREAREQAEQMLTRTRAAPLRCGDDWGSRPRKSRSIPT